VSRNLNRLSVAGVAFVAAGLLALPPTVAYAHTNDVFTAIAVPSPTYYDLVFAAADKDTAEVALLPETTPFDDSIFPTGLEIVDEQGYMTHVMEDEDPETSIPLMAALSMWDHETGEFELGMPLTLPDDITDVGGLFEGYDVAQVFLTKLLDSTADGALLTLGVLFGWTETEDAYSYGVYVLSVDPATGLATPVASLAEDSEELYIYSVGLATDPVTGITWLFVLDTGLMTNSAVEIDFDEPLEPPIAAMGSFLEEAPATLEELSVGLETIGDSGIDATAIELGDLEEFPGIADAFGPNVFLFGADFDEAGTLWFHYLDVDSEEDLALGLASAPAPFSLDAAVVDSGLMNLEDDWEPLFSSPYGLQGLIAVEDGALAATGVGSAAALAPLGAVAVALLGGVLMLAGRRRRIA